MKDKITEKFNSALDYISEAPGKVKEFFKDAYSDIVNNLKDAFEKLKDKASELRDAIASVFDGLKENGKNFIKKAKEKINDVKDYFSKNKQDIFIELKDAQKSSNVWIKETSTTILKSLRKGTYVVGDVILFTTVLLVVMPIEFLYEQTAINIKKVSIKYTEIEETITEKKETFIQSMKTEWESAKVEWSVDYRKVKRTTRKYESLKYLKTFESFKN